MSERCRGMKSYHDRYPCCIEHGKDNVGSPSNVSDGRRSDVDNQEVQDPIGGRRNRRTFLTQTERKDFRGVYPNGGLEADSKGTLEDEEHCRGTNTGTV